MKNKDEKKRVLDFLRGELPIEDLDTELVGELAKVAREEVMAVNTANLELKEKIENLDKEIKELKSNLETVTAEKEEVTNRVKEFKELEKTRVSERKETLLADIKDEINQLGLTIPEKEEEDTMKDLDGCKLETLEQIVGLLKVAESTDISGLTQTRPTGEAEEGSDDKKEEDSEETKPEDALPEGTGSEEPNKPHETLEKIRSIITSRK